MQTRLDARLIEYRVVFAAGDKGEVGHICEHRPGAILSVEPKQGTRLWELVRGEIARDRRECLAQFRSVASVAPIAKTAELCGIKTDLSRVIELAHSFPQSFPLSAVFPVQLCAF
jgi:hypothetical protein